MGEPLVKLVKTLHRGRGLVAMRDIAAGTPIFAEDAAVAHREHLGPACCPHCFRPTSSCAANPCLTGSPGSDRYLRSLASPAFLHVASQSAAQGQRFPVIAAKLALRCHFIEDGSDIVAQVGSLVAPMQALRKDAGGFPPDFVAAHDMASKSLAPVFNPPQSTRPSKKKLLSRGGKNVAGASGSFFNLEWFCGIMGRLHLNTMRTDTGLSVLYVLGSYFNHGCRPNVAPVYDGARVEWRAVRDIFADDECLISYYDGRNEVNRKIGSDLLGNASNIRAQNAYYPVSPKERPESASDEFLNWNYGFRCSESCSCGRF